MYLKLGRDEDCSAPSTASVFNARVSLMMHVPLEDPSFLGRKHCPHS